MKMLKRRYPSNLASVSKARREVTSFARSCRLLSCDVSDIALATGEACNNAAEHGHVSGGHFRVICSYEHGEFAVEVADEGAGFDPIGKGECIDPDRLGIRGLGIFIMKSLMDDVCFTMKGAGTSVKMMKFGLTSQRTLAQTPGLSGNGHASRTVGLGSVHNGLKSLFERARIQMGSRRQR
jgi:anti-sigma regulatory factor (Ser/Thr protein kinase)